MANKFIAAKLASLFESEQMTDVVFCVGDSNDPVRFPAHKLIMVCASPVFETMFQSGLNEQTAKEVAIKDVDPAAFESVLSFIYSGKMIFQSIKHTCNILYIAEKYMLPDSVFDECVNCLVKNVTSQEFYTIYQAMNLFALKSKRNGGKLLKTIWEVLYKHGDETLQNAEFVNLDLEDVDAILSRDTLGISSESIIFDVLMNWAEHQCSIQNLDPTDENKAHVVGSKTMAVIRFTNMNWEEFELGPGQTDVLTLNEKKKMQKILSTNSSDTWLSPQTKETYRTRGSTRSFEIWICFDDYISHNKTTCETLVLAASHDIVLTKLEFVPQSIDGSLAISITLSNLRNYDVIWQKCCVVDSVDLKVTNDGRFCVSSDTKRCIVSVDDVFLRAQTTYKMTVCVCDEDGGGGHLHLTNPGKMKYYVCNEQFFAIVAKGYRTRNVTREWVEGDESWNEMLKSLCTKPPLVEKVNIIGPISVSEISFIV